MSAAQTTPLTWERSASGPTNPTVSDNLPDEVVTCLQNARFLHLATCTHNRPHVSLMNYTYLPSHPFTPSLPAGPLIIMTSNPSSKKTINLVQNPHVSLLVHDWVSSRPPNINERDRSPVGARTGRSSLANMLMQMNSAAVSSISATINGDAAVLDAGTDAEQWCKQQHLANNTFTDNSETAPSDTTAQFFSTSPSQSRVLGDGGRGSYIEDDEVRVVVVRIRDGRISDWKGGVKDWVIADNSAGINDVGVDAGGGPMVNGIVGADTGT